MEVTNVLIKVREAYRVILGNNLVGLYIHGSIALGCFHFDRSDVDFLVVVRQDITQGTKEALIDALLTLEPEAPPKSFEMSVVLLANCQSFVYPTPFLLHYSCAHTAQAKENLSDYCRAMQGTDPDLAAHFSITRYAGIVLCGEAIDRVFAPVPHCNYVDSLLQDVEYAEGNIGNNPLYMVLSLCRVLAYLQDRKILSKEQGGLWGIANLHNAAYQDILRRAVDCYTEGGSFNASEVLLKAYRSDLIRQIKAHINI